MATTKFLLPLFMLLCMTTASITAQNQSKTRIWIIVSYVKENAQSDYEKWMTDVFFAPMKTTQDPILKKQYLSTRWLTPVWHYHHKFMF